ncbi:MAG: hypothetical protein KGI04_03370 [Candidatus Micrarchaeota archaeon]|nr:hypothetical protein [Candidatus Micrarchaeota archaeon]
MDERKSEIKSAIDKAEISLILDNYDDIFSSFDPRPYDERALSEDFLKEAKNAARGKRRGIELRFMVPATLRNTKSEDLIKARLKEHFRKHYSALKGEFARRRRLAILMMLAGIAIGVADAILLSFSGISIVVRDTVEIVFTPASWYTIWNGLDRLLIRPQEDAAEESFNKKMTDAQITFTSY